MRKAGEALGRPCRRRYLFVLAHMRSYSSVLCHVLGSHPQINGYCETHTRYRTALDLLRLRWRVKRLTGEPVRAGYVLDKVLHDYPIAGSILNSDRTRAILLVRRPRDAVRSIIERALSVRSAAWHRDFELVARYYETRLAGLLRLAEVLRGRAVFLEAEMLMRSPHQVLEQLGAFLELSTPLHLEYRPFLHTGEPEFGDSSAAIRTGHLTGPSGERRTSVSLPKTLAQRLQTAYDFWCAAMRKSCPTVESGETASVYEDLAQRSD